MRLIWNSNESNRTGKKRPRFLSNTHLSLPAGQIHLTLPVFTLWELSPLLLELWLKRHRHRVQFGHCWHQPCNDGVHVLCVEVVLSSIFGVCFEIENLKRLTFSSFSLTFFVLSTVPSVILLSQGSQQKLFSQGKLYLKGVIDSSWLIFSCYISQKSVSYTKVLIVYSQCSHFEAHAERIWLNLWFENPNQLCLSHRSGTAVSCVNQTPSDHFHTDDQWWPQHQTQRTSKNHLRYFYYED